MKALLKTDFKRLSKDKLLLVMGIVAVVFAAMTPLLYAALFSGMGMEDDPMLSAFITGKAQFFGSFSLGNNLGLIAPVLLAIALCKDFSYGTVRNKIISGKSRSAIFLSLFVTCATVLITVMLLHAFLTLGISLMFFEYQPTPFTMADFGYFLASLAFEILVLLWVAALLSCLCACMKNVGLVIVLYIAISFALVIAGSILQVVLMVMEATGDNEALAQTLRFIDRINVANAATYIGTGTTYSLTDVLYLTLPATAGTLGLLGLGLWRFNKKDLK
jgi:ABC-type transport system involved in multi-copper enzyme maturation permease subunit